MQVQTYSVLLAEPDARLRALFLQQLAPLSCTVRTASSGAEAMQLLALEPSRIVVSELYLKTGEDDCLLSAIRRGKTYQKTRTIALTSHATHADREWAMRAGADAYLIKPTRAERFRYVVGRLAGDSATRAPVRGTATSPLSRRDTLDAALDELEKGQLDGAKTIVFSRAWWETQKAPKQGTYRRRAKKLGIRLRSDSALAAHFVEIRGTAIDAPLSTEKAETQHRA